MAQPGDPAVDSRVVNNESPPAAITSGAGEPAALCGSWLDVLTFWIL
jgi:hypothetical protein